MCYALIPTIMQHTNSYSSIDLAYRNEGNGSIDLGVPISRYTHVTSHADPLFLRMCLDVSRMVAAWFNPSVPPSSALWSMYLDRKEDKQLI